MPAMLDDPDSPPIYRTSGAEPYPDPKDPNPPLPPDIVARQVTLRDRITIATLIPFSSASQVPALLLAYLCDQLNREIEKGDTYPFVNPMAVENFGPYWFANFGAIMLLGEIAGPEEVTEGKDWSRECLGSFYIKPNYPGRSSHVCNGGFLVTDASRNKGVGRLMGEGYLEWAPKLGYTYSVFNLVYETNVASCRIWDALGFKRIGKVKGCGNLKSYPGVLIDAHIYGRDLGPEGEDFVSEERFDKIRFYLKHGKYPNGADRAEKSRLRSAATHYKLDGERLMLKDKEVIGDRQQQYEIARRIHVLNHGGINKTTATIAEKYHWVRIKETVSQVIRNCAECKEMAKPPVVKPESTTGTYTASTPKRVNGGGSGDKHTGGVSAAGRIVALGNNSEALDEHILRQQTLQSHSPHVGADDDGMDSDDVNVLMQQQNSHHRNPHGHHAHHHQPSHAPVAVMQGMQGYRVDIPPIDPQIMEDVAHHLTQFNNSNTSGGGGDGSGSSGGDHYTSGDDTIVVQHPHHHHHHHTDYQALLAGTDPHGHHGLMGVVDDDVDMDVHHHHSHQHHQVRHMGQQHHHNIDDDNEAMAAKATAAARAAQEVMRGGEEGEDEDDDDEGEGEREREIQQRLVMAGYGGGMGSGGGDGEHGPFGNA